MKYLLPASMLLGSALGQGTLYQWTLTFWEGIECTGGSTGSANSGDATTIQSYCEAIPDYGVTSAADYEIFNEEYTYTLGLHNTDDCSDNGGQFQGMTSQPICLPLQSYTYYSITPSESSTGAKRLARSPSNKRRSSINERRTSAVATRTNVEASTAVLETRINVAALGVAVGAFVAGENFFSKAGTNCPQNIAADGFSPGQAGLCAYDIIAGVFASLVGIIAGGVGLATSKRADVLQTLLDTDLSNPTWNITTFAIPAIVDSAGVAWDSIALQLAHKDEGYTLHSTYSIHPETGRQLIGSTGQSDPASISSRMTDNGFTCYYGFENGDTDVGGQIEDDSADYNADATQLGVPTYNAIRDNDSDSFCLEVQYNGASVTKGFFAMIDGTFTDQADMCQDQLP